MGFMELWRPLFLLVALAAVLALATIVSMPPLQENAMVENSAANYSMGRAFAGDSGGESVLYVPIIASGGKANATAYVFSSRQMAPNRIEWREGASSGAGKSSLLKKAVFEKASEIGWAAGNFSGEFGGGAKYVIVPSGAWPYGILDMIAKNGSLPESTVLVYFGVMDGSAIMDDGSVVKYSPWPTSLSGDGQMIGGKALEGAYRIGMKNCGEIWIVPHAPDEILDFNKAAEELFEEMAKAPQMRPGWKEFPLSDGKNVIFADADGNQTYARARVEEKGKTVRAFDAGQIAIPAGKIIGPKEAGNGEAAAFQVRLYPNLPQGENLEYYAAIYNGEGKLENRMKIGSGNTRERWVGAFSYSGWNGSGDYVVSIEDQYRRVFGRGFVHVPVYTIKEMWAAGAERKYALQKDGKPAGNEKIMVWKDDSSDSQNFTLSSGTVVIASKYGEGFHVLHFKIGPSTIDYGFAESGGALGTYAKYGIPGALFAAIVFLLLRPKARAAYKIRLESLMAPNPHGVRIGWNEFSEIFPQGKKTIANGALSLHEIQGALLSKKINGEGIAVDEENLRILLDELAKDGRLSECRGYYALRGGGGDDGICALALSRELCDRLIENGIAAERKTISLFAEKKTPRREWLAYSEGQDVMKGMKSQREVVFWDEEGIEKFLAGAKTDSRAYSQMWLAMHENKLRLCTIGKLMP